MLVWISVNDWRYLVIGHEARAVVQQRYELDKASASLLVAGLVIACWLRLFSNGKEVIRVAEEIVHRSFQITLQMEHVAVQVREVQHKVLLLQQSQFAFQSLQQVNRGAIGIQDQNLVVSEQHGHHVSSHLALSVSASSQVGYDS